MKRKIIGVTVGSPLPKPNLKQTDPRKGDYVKGKDIIPSKVSDLENDSGYLTDHQDISGKLDANKLPEAINTALAQAKASGEFDGKPGYTPVKDKDYFDGKDGYTPVKGKDYFDGDDYVLTPDDKTEIAEQAAALVEVPEGSGGGIAVTGATVGQTVKISAVDENGVPTAWMPTDFPSGGSGGSSETAAEMQLATGTIVTETAAKTTIDTGITLGDLKKYKRFVILFRGASNVGLGNVYFEIGGSGISRSDAESGVVCVYEWINVKTNLLHAAAVFQANKSLVQSIGSNYIRAGMPSSWKNGPTGSTGVLIFDLSSKDDSAKLEIYLTNATTIDYDWEVRGLTV